MATHSSVLAWRIPGTEEPVGLPSMGLHRVGHNWSDLAAAAAAYKIQCGHLISYTTYRYSHSFSCALLPVFFIHTLSISSVQSLSCVGLCDPMDYSMPGFPDHHQLLELTQIHIHRVDDDIQPPQPLSSPSPPTFNLSSIRVFSSESVLCIRWPKYWSFSFSISPPMNIQDWFPLGWTGLICLQSKGLWRVFSNTIVQKHQFFRAQLSSQSNSHIHAWLLEKP